MWDHATYPSTFLTFVFFRFGVCCLFILSSTSSTISQNCSYIQNPGFPTALAGGSAVSYTINKCNDGE